MHRMLVNSDLYATLLEIDRAEARGWHGGACPHCGEGVLHAASYPRAPRGGPPALPEGYEQRHSFCCDGCRRRTTPPSVRFLGRRWYLAPFVVVLSALVHGVTRRRVDLVREAFGDRVSWATLRRWRRWWLMFFPQTDVWRAGRGRLAEPVDERRLPESLLEGFIGSAVQRLEALLCFLGALSTASCPGLLTGVRRR